MTDGSATINATPIVRLLLFPQWDIYTRAGARQKGAEIILDETPYERMGKERERACLGEKITPLVVFLRFFLDGTMDLVGTVQLQNTL